MKIINWNISYQNDSKIKFKYLQEITNDDATIIILQEVTPDSYEILKEIFQQKFSIEYSLNYRKPSKFDSKARKLGIAILCSKDIAVNNAFVLERALLPDRTLAVDIKYQSKEYRIIGFHSITGCDYKKAKSIQFLSMSEMAEKYKPDIIGMDLNEPEYDHYKIENMKFFDNKDNGNGIRTFLETLKKNNLEDSYILNYDTAKYVENEPLAVSHIINKKMRKRYDFVFLNKEKFKNYYSTYDYEKSIKAGSDHSAIIIESN